MRTASSRPPAGLLAGLLLVGLLHEVAGPDPARAEDGGFDLVGTWFVVAHFKDESTNNPDAMRWVDEVWVFEESGSRLKWTKYPIVVFEDKSGRFETRGRNPRSRVLAAWEPNNNQRAELMGGPRVNERGSKSKSLRGSAAKGWKSVDRMQVRSAMTVGYQEKWSITGLDSGKPTFLRVDTMGTLGSGTSEGQIIYEVTEAGEVPRGRFERDGIRRGTFLMMRTPAPRGLIKKEGTPNERMQERAREQFIEEERRRYDEGEGLSEEAQQVIDEQRRKREQELKKAREGRE